MSLVVLQGTTVDFLNSDPVGHNVYWPSISGNKKLAHNMGTGRRVRRNRFSSTIWVCLAAVQCPSGDVRLHVVVVPRPISP